MVKGALSAAFLLLSSVAAAAQTYPSRSIQLVVPYPAGGISDFVARLFAAQAEKRLDQAVVVNNRVGAAGMIGTQAVARAEPDGYTLLVRNQGASRDVPLTPIAMLARAPLVLLATPTTAKTVADLREQARRGTALKYGAVPGSTSHYVALALGNAIGARLALAPYQTPAVALQGLTSGETNLAIEPLGAALPLVQSGQAVALAVTGPRRSPAMPDVPTLSETGISGIDVIGWVGLFGPAKLPSGVVARLTTATAGLLEDPEFRERLARIGFEPGNLIGEAFAAFIERERRMSIAATEVPACCPAQACGDMRICQGPPQ